MATAAKGTATKSTSTRTTAKSDTGKSYAEQAATLAADTRKLADDMRQQLADLVNRCGELNDLEPAAEDGPAADTVRRVPMSVGDIDRALEGLATVAGELAQKAAL